MSDIHFFHIKDLCRIFGISRPCVYNWIKRGYLPKPVKVGTVPLWDAEAIQSYKKQYNTLNRTYNINVASNLSGSTSDSDGKEALF